MYTYNDSILILHPSRYIHPLSTVIRFRCPDDCFYRNAMATLPPWQQQLEILDVNFTFAVLNGSMSQFLMEKNNKYAIRNWAMEPWVNSLDCVKDSCIILCWKKWYVWWLAPELQWRKSRTLIKMCIFFTIISVSTIYRYIYNRPYEPRPPSYCPVYKMTLTCRTVPTNWDYSYMEDLPYN